MFNTKKIPISAGAFALALLGACSDDKSVAGATVDPDVLAENNNIPLDIISVAETKAQMMKISFSTKPSSTKKIEFTSDPTSQYSTSPIGSHAGVLDSGSIVTYGEEFGMVGSCYIGSESYEAKTRIYDDGVVEQFVVQASTGACNVLRERFETFNYLEDGESWFSTDSCETGKLTYNFLFKTDDSSYINDVFKESHLQIFEKEINYNCSSLFSEEYNDSGKTNEKLADSLITENWESCKISGQNVLDVDKLFKDTTSFLGRLMLDKYVTQFSGDAANLAFDSNVVAYNGTPSFKCVQSGFEVTDCFWGIDTYINSEKCKLVVVHDKFSKVPSGHVLSKVSKGSIEITNVNATCTPAAEMDHNAVFLVRDCDGLLAEGFEITHKEVSTQSMAKPYGEWVKDNSLSLFDAELDEPELTEDEKNLHFDSHVLAYRTGWPEECYSSEYADNAEVNLDFAKTCFLENSSLEKTKDLKEECKYYVFTTTGSSSPKSINVLNKVSEASVEITTVSENSLIATADILFRHILVEDCDGLLDNGFEVDYKVIKSDSLLTKIQSESSNLMN